jgi:hypothetical protein
MMNDEMIFVAHGCATYNDVVHDATLSMSRGLRGFASGKCIGSTLYFRHEKPKIWAFEALSLRLQ